MSILITVLLIIASVLLILAVLIQQPKGSGLAANFSSATMVMGVKRTTEFIEKFTWGSVVVIMLLAAISTMFLKNTGSAEVKKAINEEQIQNYQLPANAPGTKGPGQAPDGVNSINPDGK